MAVSVKCVFVSKINEDTLAQGRDVYSRHEPAYPSCEWGLFRKAAKQQSRSGGPMWKWQQWGWLRNALWKWCQWRVNKRTKHGMRATWEFLERERAQRITAMSTVKKNLRTPLSPWQALSHTHEENLLVRLRARWVYCLHTSCQLNVMNCHKILSRRNLS